MSKRERRASVVVIFAHALLNWPPFFGCHRDGHLPWYDDGMLRTLAAVLLTSCVSLPTLPPTPRDKSEQDRATVLVEVRCRDTAFGGSFEWTPPSTSSGVVISERHVLLAAHAVDCPAIPSVHVTLWDGHRRRVWVSDVDEKADIALAEIGDAGNFERGFAPPSLADAHFGEIACVRPAWPKRIVRCGPLFPRQNVLVTESVKGNSGAGVYDANGNLIGLVVKNAQSNLGPVTIYSPVDAKWLRGVRSDGR